MAMSVVQMIWSLIATSYTLWFTLTYVPLRPWLSWDFVHSNFNRADLYPVVFTPIPVLTAYYILWWMLPASSLIFIAFFIFGKDAMDEYKACFSWIQKRVFQISTKQQGSSLFVK
jgi:pheromone a factor receptor